MRHNSLLFVVLALFGAACGPYLSEDDARTAEAGRTARSDADRLSAFGACGDASTASTPAYLAGTKTAVVIATRDALTEAATGTSESTAVVVGKSPAASSTACASEESTSATPTMPMAITTTPTAAPTLLLTPFDLPTGTAALAGDVTGTPRPGEVLDIVATQTYRAGPQPYGYLSIGDGLQWGCCGALGSSSPSLFGQYLESRIGKPVIWQSPGSGYDTTTTFINGRDGFVGQLDGALELMAHYKREGIPLAAITMSIGGNNLVDIGRACAAPPCLAEYVAGLDVLRADLHVIYSRISAAKDANTPLIVLLYYDAEECSGNPYSGPAVVTWNAVIAEVASQYGAFFVDGMALFAGHCDWIDTNGLDANVAGHAAIAAEYARVYGSLPAAFVLP
jgi:hypothetical protein